MLKPLIMASLLGFFLAPIQALDRNTPFNKKAFEIYKTTVEMHTAVGHGQVPKLADYLASEFAKGGFPKNDIHVLKVGKAAALVVRYRGDGRSHKKPISISAHMDVVEALKQDWQRDPFKLIEENGYFYGRGTSDDKAGMTAVVTTFLRLKAEGWVPNRDLIIAFSGDEETSMASTKALVSTYKNLIDSEYVLNADAGGGSINEDGSVPQSYGIQAAEKTYADIEISVTNPGGHSSLPRTDNAIYSLASALTKLQKFHFPVRINPITRKIFKHEGNKTPGKLGKAMLRFAADPTDKSAIKILRSDPFINSIMGTTCVATLLKAGHAPNALPQSATANINCRIFPGTGIETIISTLKKVIDNDAIKLSLVYEPTPNDASPLRNDLLTALRKAVDTQYPGLEIIPFMSAGGTDGMHFRAAGIPSYGVDGVFMKNSDVFIHGLNERMPVNSFYANIEHWYVLLKELTK